MQPSPLKIWFLAFRPQTLVAAIAPVLMGTALAYGDGVHDFPTAFIALCGALTIQIGTNLANDYFDFQKGADTSERLGPLRVTQAGLIPPLAMMCAIILFFSLAALVTIGLILRAGWPIAIIGILAILSGILYTAGPFPLGYLGLGEIFVFIFFGPVAVAGTYYVQALGLSPAVIISGIAPGLLASAILVVNNLRDIVTDKKCGKMTLAVRFGRPFAQAEYFFFIMSAALMPIIIFYLTQDHIETLFSSSIALLAFPSLRTVFTKWDGPSLNKALASTGQLLLIYSLIFSVGWISLDYFSLHRIIRILGNIL